MASDVLRRASHDLATVAVVYAHRLEEFGSVPRGVFWKTEEGQKQRFDVLLGIIDEEAHSDGRLRVNDLGCGYGALFEHIKDMPAMRDGRYIGYDICEDMVAAAQRSTDDPRTRFDQSMIAEWDADYSFASGTYNMRIEVDDEEWADYIKASLTQLWSRSHRGMAFNMLSVHGAKKRLTDLYYADPGPYFDFCVRTLSKRVVLLHDYPLPEWTIMVLR